jgi:hypothetical protein
MPSPADHAANRARSLEIAELRRRGLLFRTIGARLGVSAQLAWQQMAKGCPHFWGHHTICSKSYGKEQQPENAAPSTS